MPREIVSARLGMAQILIANMTFAKWLNFKPDGSFIGMMALVTAVLLATALPALAQFSHNNKTLLYYEPQHGTQVEFLASGGRSHLWYPGNKIILTGKWKTIGNKTSGQMCFQYGANTYNPVTGQKGSNWECMPYQAWASAVSDSIAGDVFGLSRTQKAPFRLTKSKTSIANIARKLGVKLSGRPSPNPNRSVKSGGSNSPGSTELDPVAYCQTVKAEVARTDRESRRRAAVLYFHGKILGKPCVTVDYDKTFTILRELGDMKQYRIFLDILRARAEAGIPKAVRAYEKYRL
jgi:hypothetical protein